MVSRVMAGRDLNCTTRVPLLGIVMSEYEILLKVYTIVPKESITKIAETPIIHLQMSEVSIFKLDRSSTAHIF